MENGECSSYVRLLLAVIGMVYKDSNGSVLYIGNVIEKLFEQEIKSVLASLPCKPAAQASSSSDGDQAQSSSVTCNQSIENKDTQIPDLHHAIDQPNVDFALIRLIVEHEKDNINECDTAANGYTPLIKVLLASSLGDEAKWKRIQLLLDNNADWNAKDSKDISAVEVLNKFCPQLIKVIERSKYGHAFQLALRHQDFNHNQNRNNRANAKDFVEPDIELQHIFQQMIANNCDFKWLNVKLRYININLNYPNQRGDTLMMAVIRAYTLSETEKIKRLRLLLKFGADWNQRNNIGESSRDLAEAISSDYIERVEDSKDVVKSEPDDVRSPNDVDSNYEKRRQDGKKKVLKDSQTTIKSEPSSTNAQSNEHLRNNYSLTNHTVNLQANKSKVNLINDLTNTTVKIEHYDSDDNQQATTTLAEASGTIKTESNERTANVSSGKARGKKKWPRVNKQRPKKNTENRNNQSNTQNSCKVVHNEICYANRNRKTKTPFIIAAHNKLPSCLCSKTSSLEDIEAIVFSINNINYHTQSKKGDLPIQLLIRTKGLVLAEKVERIKLLLKYGASWRRRNFDDETGLELVPRFCPGLMQEFQLDDLTDRESENSDDDYLR